VLIGIHIAVTLVFVALILIGLMIPLIAVATSAGHIAGALAYSTRNGDLPMRDSYYEVWKKCGLFDLMTCAVSSGKTDLSGLFNSTIDGGDCNCWVRVFTKVPDVVDVLCADEPNAACDTQSGKAAALQYDFSSINVKSGDTLDYGKHILPSSTLAAEGAQISDTILNTWLFVRGQVGVNIPSVSVQFPCEALCPGGKYFDPYTIGHIYVKPNEDAKTIINTYAQYVMWYHTTGLSDTQVTTLFEKSLQQNGDVVLLAL
jgi:hypothetical protein